MKKTLLVLVLVIAAVFAYLSFGRSTSSESTENQTVAVVRGTIQVSAVAVGKVEARFEVPVTATSGGVVTQKFVSLGQKVNKGDPLFEVRPVLTDAQKLQAERLLLGAKEAADETTAMVGGKNLAGLVLRAFQGGDSMDRMKRGAERSQTDAEEQLNLLLYGSAVIDGRTIDYLIRAPIAGHVIAEELEVGEPVVPTSTYGAGTVLVTLADLEHPVFRGTVDEIDVGRLEEGMSGTLTLGARPGIALDISLTEISLRAESQNNAVVFAVELDVAPPEDLVLRSGYSAVANIRIHEAADVLILPERVVDVRDGKAFVLQDDGDGGTREVEIETGLSDGLQIEILSGLEEGDVVLERNF